jgi:hypothetical protein
MLRMLQNKADTVRDSSLELIKTHISLAYISKYKMSRYFRIADTTIGM